MRPHVRSSSEYRRRSIASTPEMIASDSDRRRSSSSGFGVHFPSSENAYRRMSLASNPQTASSRHGSSSSLSSLFGLQSSSLAFAGGARDAGCGARRSPPKRDSLLGVQGEGHGKRTSEGDRDRRGCVLDCSRQSVNSFRIKIFVVLFIIALILYTTFRYFNAIG